jgi:cytochrome c553
VVWRFAPLIGLLAAFAPTMAQAQTNLDQGKSASQIFAAACAECHKSPQALAKGRSVSALTDFLGEHYTTNAQQAAALAAYVKGGRGETPIGVAPQSRGQKPKAKQANAASTEEAKPSKPEARPAPKPDEAKPANAKLRRPAREASKPKDDTSTPGGLLGIIAPEPKHVPATATRNRRNEPKVTPSQEPAAATPEPAAAAHEPASVTRGPAAVTAEPMPRETPRQEASPGPPAVAAPANAASGNAASGESGEDAVPRDNIPD